jgi:hypothetical protein
VNRNPTFLCLAFLLAAACDEVVGFAQTQPASKPAAGTQSAPAVNDTAAMDAAIAVLMAKPEQPSEKIKIQHVLISFKGAPRVPGMTRTLDEAKALAADVFKRAGKGEDFTALMTKHSNDPGGGIYDMTKAGRAQMVAGFGNVGFRLKVGEIGVAPHHAKDSPYGWHIIKRLE